MKQVKVHSEAETWKINEPVTIHPVDGSKGFWNVAPGEGTPGEVLRHLDSKSELYRLLKNDMQITRKSFDMYAEDDPTMMLVPGYSRSS